MLGLFFVPAGLGGESVGDLGISPIIGLLGIGMIILVFLIMIGFYVFVSLAYMSIAKKIGKTSPTGIAWILGLGPLIIAWHASGMHWWPWLLFIGFYIPFLNLVIFPIFWVFSVIWMWKMFVALGRPGWWSLISLLVVIGMLFTVVPSIGFIGGIIAAIGFIASLIVLGIAAWGEGCVSSPESV